MARVQITSKITNYKDGDQRFTVRVLDPGSPVFTTGEILDLTRQQPVPPTEPPTEPPPTEPPPTEPPTEPPPTEPPPSTGSRQLLGGWNFPFDWQRGAIAIDFSSMTLYMVGHSQRQEILEFALPPMGTGDESTWPLVQPSRVIQRFWSTGNAYGLAIFRGTLWVAPRVFYDQPPSSEENLTLYAQDGETISLPYKRQVFAGFVKRGPGLDPFIGGGGYDSGQGTRSGPSLATLDGQILLEYGWPGHPGDNLEHWNERAPREPNYSVKTDDWVGWQPRIINGELQGRWASDRIYAGGLAIGDQVLYWPWMAAQGDAYPLDYAYQTYTFAADGDNRTYEYTYTAQGQFVSYQRRFELGVIAGQELGPDGLIYLHDMGQGWLSGPGYSAIKVFG